MEGKLFEQYWRCDSCIALALLVYRQIGVKPKISLAQFVWMYIFYSWLCITV